MARSPYFSVVGGANKTFLRGVVLGAIPIALITLFGVLLGFFHLANAIQGSVTIFPAWDVTARLHQSRNFCVEDRSYSCDFEQMSSLFTLTEQTSGCNGEAETERPVLKFDLSAIPDNATITSVNFSVVVTHPTQGQQTVRRLNNDQPENLSCSTSALFDAMVDGATYGSFMNWNSGGVKTLDLGSSAVADVQQRIKGSDALALSIGSNAELTAVIASSDVSPASRPNIVVTYTQPPEAPTDFALAGKTTSSLTWAWIEQAFTETNNVVQNQSRGIVCAAGSRSGANNALSCTETGLLPNTQYTRHASAIDPQDTSDSQELSAFTLIEPLGSVVPLAVTPTSITVGVGNHLSNLEAGSSGVNFTESTAGDSSGWIKQDSWMLGGLRPNTQYRFAGQARNGDAEGTPISQQLSRFTLPLGAAVTANHTVGTWYTTPEFVFANTVPWGSGGVQYYRYVWTTNSAHTFTGNEAMWSGNSLSLTAPIDGDWYLAVQPYNGDGVAVAPTTYGPYRVDSTAPVSPYAATARASIQYTRDLKTLRATWNDSTDALSGVEEYQYAIGTTPGGTNVRPFTAVGKQTTVQVRGVSLRNGAHYYVTVRSRDVAGNVSLAVTVANVLANTKAPVITDRQTGDAQHRRSGGTAYNVDFARATTGPQMRSAEYQVSSDKKWRPIFNANKDAYTANWKIDFSALREGANKVSVRVTGLDGLTATSSNVFTVVKDTAPAPHISGVLQSYFTQTRGDVELLVLGEKFRAGAVVWIGGQRSRSSRLTGRGTLMAIIPGKKLLPGAYDLRVENPNGLSHTRRRKITIAP